MYVVEQNVPVPVNAGAQRKYPFTNMKVGESFFVPCQAEAVPKMQQTLWQAAKSSIGPKKVTVRKVTDNGTIGLRAWRIA